MPNDDEDLLTRLTELEAEIKSLKGAAKQGPDGSDEDQKKNEKRNQRKEKLNEMAKSLNRQIER